MRLSGRSDGTETETDARGNVRNRNLILNLIHTHVQGRGRNQMRGAEEKNRVQWRGIEAELETKTGIVGGIDQRTETETEIGVRNAIGTEVVRIPVID